MMGLNRMIQNAPCEEEGKSAHKKSTKNLKNFHAQIFLTFFSSTFHSRLHLLSIPGQVHPLLTSPLASSLVLSNPALYVGAQFVRMWMRCLFGNCAAFAGVDGTTLKYESDKLKIFLLLLCGTFGQCDLKCECLAWRLEFSLDSFFPRLELTFFSVRILIASLRRQVPRRLSRQHARRFADLGRQLPRRAGRSERGRNANGHAVLDAFRRRRRDAASAVRAALPDCAH
jgi:hypothetical protein